MTTKFEIQLQAGPLVDGGREWVIESNILVATDETDPGATPDTKQVERFLAQKLSDLIYKMFEELKITQATK